MNTTTDNTAHNTANGSTSKPMKTSRVAKAKELMPENFDALLQRAKDLPELIQTEVKANPYRTLGIAVGVGFGIGAVMSSRIARMFLVTAGGYALNEVARTHIKKLVDEFSNADAQE